MNYWLAIRRCLRQRVLFNGVFKRQLLPVNRKALKEELGQGLMNFQSLRRNAVPIVAARKKERISPILLDPKTRERGVEIVVEKQRVKPEASEEKQESLRPS